MKRIAAGDLRELDVSKKARFPRERLLPARAVAHGASDCIPLKTQCIFKEKMKKDRRNPFAGGSAEGLPYAFGGRIR